MSEQIIGMDDMMAVYEVTDRFGIDRETISVPLEKEGHGNVVRGSGRRPGDHRAQQRRPDAGLAARPDGGP